MKNIVKALVFVAITLFSFNAQAQDKFGHIDSNEILSLMPESKNAEKAIEAFALELQDRLKAMYSEYESKTSDYQQNVEQMTPVVQESKLKEIQDLEVRINQFQQNSQAELQAKRADLLRPIIEKAQKAVDDVAQENGYTYVFDLSTGTVVFKTDANDLMPLVKKKLGL